MRRDAWHCRPCDKYAYPSEGRARGVIEYLAENHSDRKLPRRTYPCQYGNGWHITSKEERKAV